MSKQSTLYTVDGDVSMGIKDVCYATVQDNNHTFRTIKEKAQSPRAVMEFATIYLANGLFNGNRLHHGRAVRQLYLYGGYDFYGGQYQPRFGQSCGIWVK